MINNSYIGANPITTFNPIPHSPVISKTAFISPFCFIVGDVTIRSNVYVGPFVSIRADEGSPFYIGKNTNLQEGVILHGFKHQYVTVKNLNFSIYIGKRVTCAHGSIVHGPSLIGDDVFIGLRTTIIHATIGKGCFIGSHSLVTDGVILKPNSYVPPMTCIDTQEKADALTIVPPDKIEFAKHVQSVNQEFPFSYATLFGYNRY